jgi:hypothetical protein
MFGKYTYCRDVPPERLYEINEIKVNNNIAADVLKYASL